MQIYNIYIYIYDLDGVTFRSLVFTELHTVGYCYNVVQYDMILHVHYSDWSRI